MYSASKKTGKNRIRPAFICCAFVIVGLLISQTAFSTSLTPGTSGNSPDGAGAFDLTALTSVGDTSLGQLGLVNTGTGGTFANQGLSHLINGGPIGENITNPNTVISFWDYSFTLPIGWDPASIIMTGQFMGDDGVALYVNGSTTAALSYGNSSYNTYTPTPPGKPWNTLQTWSLSSADGLVPGVNTLKIVTPDISNIPNGGFLANDYLSVQGDSIPEPSTLLLLGCGVLGIIGYSLRRKFQGNVKE